MNKECRVLIIDGLPQNIQLIGSALRKKGYSVSFALDAKKALELIGVSNFDLIITEILLGCMTGFELCEKIKKEDSTKDIPVIFCSIKNSTDDVIRGINAGAADFITKPLNITEFLMKVETQIKIVSLKRKLAELSAKTY